MNPDDPKFGGIGRLYGRDKQAAFAQAKACIVGIGGVGSWVAESLARSGIGSFILIDLDDICVTNTNRQIHALEGNYGQPKVSAMTERIRLISPESEITEYQGFYSESSSEEIFALRPDIVIDAIDVMRPKCHLIASCYDRKIPLVTCGGAGGRTDASAIIHTDLSKTYGDPMLSLIRKQLRTKYGMPLGENGKKTGIPCVFSPEKPVFPTCDGKTSPTKDPGQKNVRMGCEAGFGSVTHITGTFGFIMAGLALNMLSSHTTT